MTLLIQSFILHFVKKGGYYMIKIQRHPKLADVAAFISRLSTCLELQWLLPTLLA